MDDITRTHDRDRTRSATQQYPIVDAVFRCEDPHQQRMQVLGVTFAIVLLVVAGLLLAYGILLQG